ncbi:hypothetical protein B9Z19DRAFT_1126359 [Tuber borchii]|uniref:Uncharacterized protein n=1 Tax=Tuber borchii TaxID=42251 RepID=A0A2T6ZT41_TUBBO|nr:hypothetical protein B9Z19DRAFT_1126359 [Tuber borchii]
MRDMIKHSESEEVLNYVLKRDEQFTIAPLVLDDIPEKIGKLFALCESVYKWKLCTREELPTGPILHEPSPASATLPTPRSLT